MEQVADTVSIVARGRLLAAGTVAALIGARGAAVRVGVADPAGDLLVARGWDLRRDGRHLVVAGAPGAAQVNEALARAGVFADEVVTVRADLESVFLELTGAAGAHVPRPRTPEDTVRTTRWVTS